METIRLYFQSFWGEFDYNDNIFVWLFKQKYNVMIDKNNPDIVVAGGGGRVYKNAKYIYFSSEPFYPDKEEMKLYNFGMSGFHKNDKTHFRFPLYLYYIYEYKKRNFIDFDFFDNKREVNLSIKPKFCVFIAGSFKGYRAEFVERLMKYKRVDISYGHYKNISVPGEGGSIIGSMNKINFIRRYKFVIGFENVSIKDGMTGHTTEKLIEPMIATSLPLYWGNYRIKEDFNTKTFLNIHDFESEEKFIEKIIEVDNNDNLYKQYFIEPLRNLNNKLLNSKTLPEMFFEAFKL
jgi:alpha(1,3/1,4) fucosyltransferase